MGMQLPSLVGETRRHQYGMGRHCSSRTNQKRAPIRMQAMAVAQRMKRWTLLVVNFRMKAPAESFRRTVAGSYIRAAKNQPWGC